MTREHSPSARLFAALLLLALALGTSVVAPAARAADSQWRAQWIANTPAVTAEAGETFPAFVTAKNIGTATWQQGTVRIAASQPYDRLSAFSNNSWFRQPDRPATLSEPSVATGQTTTFSFTMTAPPVLTPTDFKEYLAPVAEYIEWLDSCPEWCGVHIPISVQPQRPPAVRFTASPPEHIKRGDAISATADATDNVAVDHVVFSLDGADQTVSAPPYSHSFDTSGLASGSHVITVRAFDRVGLSDEAVTSFSVDRPAPGHVLIDNGADFTNDPNVTLAVEAPAGTSGIRIANNPDFANAASLPVQSTYPWTLGSRAGQRDTRIVYVRFVDPVEGDTVVSDDIILDQTRPTIARASVYRRGNRKPLAKVRGRITKGACSKVPLVLKLKAHDDRSGVVKLNFGFSPRNLGRQLGFRSQLPVTVPAKLARPALYVRVTDGAGNLSKVRKVGLRNVCG